MRSLFLDTNIVLDLLEERKPFCDDAVRLFTLAHKKKVKLYVSPVTFTTASYVLSKHGAAEERRLLSYLRQLVSVVPTDDLMIDAALSSDFKDFEDALQYFSALAVNAEVIITRNGKDFMSSTLPVMSADEWLEGLKPVKPLNC